MIESIRRTDTTVSLGIHTALGVSEPVIYFNLNTGSEIHAELLRQHLYDLRLRAKKIIARNCLIYLDKEEISKLKSKLAKEWNGSKRCWK